jgi:hypothetical protein
MLKAMMNYQFPIPVTYTIGGLHKVYAGRQGFQVRKQQFIHPGL